MFITRRANFCSIPPICRFCGHAIVTRDQFFCIECLRMVIDFADAVLKAALVPKLIRGCIQVLLRDFELMENEGRDMSTYLVLMSSIESVMELVVESKDITEEVEKMLGSCRNLAMVLPECDRETEENGAKDGAEGVKETQENVFAKEEQGEKEIRDKFSAEHREEGEKIATHGDFAKDGEADEISTKDGEDGEKEIVGIFAFEDGEEDDDVVAKDGEGDGEETGKRLAWNASTLKFGGGKKATAGNLRAVNGLWIITENVFAKYGEEGEKVAADNVPKDGEGSGKGMGDYIPVKYENEAEGATAEHIFEQDEGDDENMMGDYVPEQLRDESEC
nr:RPGR [Haemonchus contortus]